MSQRRAETAAGTEQPTGDPLPPVSIGREGRGCFAVVAGGGTGGHVVPALAVASALATHDRSLDGSVRLIGSRRGVDERLVQEAGFPVTLVPGRGIVRGLRLSNVAAVAGLAVSTCWSTLLLARWRPRVVVSMGGYASVPGGLAAAALRVPLVVVNPDAAPGAANRLLSRFARACAVAFEGTPMPRSVVTGAPVRPEVAEAAKAGRAAARQTLGLPADRTLVVAVGGSLGATRLNTAVLGLADRWADRGELALRHVVGRRDWPLVAPRAAELGAQLTPLPNAASGAARPTRLSPTPLGDGLSQTSASGRRGFPTAPASPSDRLAYQAVEYEQAMPLALAAADLVVSRAGAVTVAELCIAGRPAVLVPLPGAPDDHQTANATRLAGQGAAMILPDHECTPAGLAAVLEPLLGDERRRSQMGGAAARLGRPEAAEAVAELAARHARPVSHRARRGPWRPRWAPKAEGGRR